MRKLSIIIMMIILILFSFNIFAGSNTWEGELDPNNIITWKEEKENRFVSNNGYLHVFVINPNKISKIKEVELICKPTGIGNKIMLIGYTYYKENILYIFALLPTKDGATKYFQVEPEVVPLEDLLKGPRAIT